MVFKDCVLGNPVLVASCTILINSPSGFVVAFEYMPSIASYNPTHSELISSRCSLARRAIAKPHPSENSPFWNAELTMSRKRAFACSTSPSKSWSLSLRHIKIASVTGTSFAKASSDALTLVATSCDTELSNLRCSLSRRVAQVLSMFSCETPARSAKLSAFDHVSGNWVSISAATASVNSSSASLLPSSVDFSTAGEVTPMLLAWWRRVM
mmetsp:Transcript_6774/g.11058  ORF Transcript_6774/g.11058 Transcript_6774/m.11058 type:complete len:211 (+) Transcript_6774:1504-2136(+)